MWDAALSSTFSREALEELREELKHFEVKLMKHERAEEQASILQKDTPSGGEGGDMLYHEIEQKRDELARGIKKMETYLEDKIAASKLEL